MDVGPGRAYARNGLLGLEARLRAAGQHDPATARRGHLSREKQPEATQPAGDDVGAVTAEDPSPLRCDYHAAVSPARDVEHEFASVLGRIGLAYIFASIIYLYAGIRAQAIWFVGILIGYWLLLRFTSAPGFPPGDLSMQGNFASYIDRHIVPGKLYLGIHDPEGIVSLIPAIATGLLGILTGDFLRFGKVAPAKKSGYMLLVGVVFLVLAHVWDLVFPINKNLWTSSFVLNTGGYSLILLAIFYYIIDVRGYKKWAFFFRVIGMNSILIYMSGHFINWNFTNDAFFKWVGQLVGNPFNIVAMAICYVLVKWCFLYFMYRQKIFLRV